MKKIILFLTLITIALTPLNIYAATNAGRIDTIIASANTQTKVGDYFTINFNVRFGGLQKNTYDTYGIAVVTFTIQMDDDFIISSTSSNIWKTTAYDLGNGTYYFVSEYIEGTDNNNACIESELYCSDYAIDVNFYVKNTEHKYSSIVMKSATAAFIDLSKEYEEITEDDIITSTYNYKSTVTMNIQQASQEKYKEPNSITETTNNIPSIKSNVKDTNTISNNNKTEETNNNGLKSLKIKGYSINFNKDTKTYYIDIDNDVNSLKIDAVPENDNSTVEIIGNDDLKANNGKVLIKVKSENTENIYTITTQKVEEVFVGDNEEEKKFKIDKKYIIIGSIIIGVIILIIIIISLINRIRDKKIDQVLDSI